MPSDVVDPAAAQRGAQAARKATGISPAPQPSRARALLEWLTGYPADPTREMNPLEVLAAVPAIGAAPKLLKGATKLDEAADAAQKGIRAYHGSPHDFDRFDLSKIGTGEGAQAYGHGLYFAEKEGTARQYRNQLSDSMPTIGGRPVQTEAEAVAHQILSRQVPYNNVEEALGLANAWARAGLFRGADEAAAVRRAITENFGQPLGRAPSGKMYEVNIAADPAALLDWDAPLTRQSPQVQEALKKLGMTPRQLNNLRYTHAREPSGGDMYRALGRARSGGTHGTEYPDEATAALRAAGVPGIQYWDQGSRLAGAGTRNYTIGDDSLISILRKYGLLAGAGAGAATQRDALLQQLQGDGAQ